jgi:hypothetical protein
VTASVYFEYILFCFQYRKCTESCILNLSDQFAIIFFGDVFNYFHAVTMEFRVFSGFLIVSENLFSHLIKIWSLSCLQDR